MPKTKDRKRKVASYIGAGIIEPINPPPAPEPEPEPDPEE